MTGRKILIVDDESAIRDMLRVALEMAEYDCIEASNAQDAHALIVDEKPDLIFLKDTWYTRFEDKSMRQTMHPNVENFFLDPMINLKQSHLLKQSIKSLGVTVTNGQRAVDVYNFTGPDASAADYQAHAMACGRDLELLPGHSNLQKQVTKSQLADLYFDQQGNLQIKSSSTDVMLREKVLDRHPLAIKYLNGIRELHHSQKFMQHNISSYQKPLLFKSTFSKPYSIGN